MVERYSNGQMTIFRARYINSNTGSTMWIVSSLCKWEEAALRSGKSLPRIGRPNCAAAAEGRQRNARPCKSAS